MQYYCKLACEMTARQVVFRPLNSAVKYLDTVRRKPAHSQDK